MTVLDDARRLAGGNPFGALDDDAAWKCPFCGMPSGRHSGFGDMHRDDCPWLSMPRIVAALEAAEPLSAVVSRERFRHTEYVGETVDGRGTYSWCQSCDTSWPCNWAEAAVKNAALLTILRGETEP